MTDPGPWGAPPPPAKPAHAPPASWRRRLLWLVFVIGGGALAAILLYVAPWALRTGYDWTFVVMWGGFLLLMSLGLMTARRGDILKGVSHAAIWVAVVGLLAFGYLYRAELAEAPLRLRMALNVGAPVATGERELRVAQTEGGAFVIVGQVNGQPVLFMVDTGATDTVLSPADARRVGIDVEHLNYDQTAETANGLGSGAAWTADRLAVGGLELGAFPMVVNKAPMGGSLLGMSFLDELASFEVRDRTLILRWREGAGSHPLAPT
ncbi:retropepsin-like aspartic protease family protein [Caulobacter sp. DWR3-1-2]|uniref:retropepsin-like aspartic protease family protein n=1 Tax=Caulobacter sp. DWR3-1-2 TaxID=2804647 RepID=UPI003CEFA708